MRGAIAIGGVRLKMQQAGHAESAGTHIGSEGRNAFGLTLRGILFDPKAAILHQLSDRLTLTRSRAIISFTHFHAAEHFWDAAFGI
mmetsp:Transcript_3726/g.14150  ORF Transcript_3726/g.14150 Transcript_3726/m.14150 type:complete len:86 (+) Transcript_3726:3-260(+)